MIGDWRLSRKKKRFDQKPYLSNRSSLPKRSEKPTSHVRKKLRTMMDGGWLSYLSERCQLGFGQQHNRA